MILLIVGLSIFLGVHSVAIVAPAWRERTIRARGAGAWKIVYSLISLAGLVLIVVGYAAARPTAVLVYAPPPFLRHVALLLMLPVFPLLIAAYLPGRIGAATRHPMLLAVKLWALAHLLANGSAADLLLFGGFLAWAAADRVSVERRPAPVRGEPRPRNDAIALAVGFALYLAFIGFVHRWITGVAPV